MGLWLAAPQLLRGVVGLALHLALEVSVKVEVALVVLGKEEAEVLEVLVREVEASAALVRVVAALVVLAKEVVVLGVVVAALEAHAKVVHHNKEAVASEVQIKVEVASEVPARVVVDSEVQAKEVHLVRVVADSEVLAKEVHLVRVVAVLVVQVKEAVLSEAVATAQIAHLKEAAPIEAPALVAKIRVLSIAPMAPLHIAHQRILAVRVLQLAILDTNHLAVPAALDSQAEYLTQVHHMEDSAPKEVLVVLEGPDEAHLLVDHTSLGAQLLKPRLMLHHSPAIAHRQVTTAQQACIEDLTLCINRTFKFIFCFIKLESAVQKH